MAPSKGMISPEQEQMMAAFERGHRLHQVVNSPGWQDVLDIMSGYCDAAEFQVTSFNPMEHNEVKDKLLWLQARSRAYREAFDMLQRQIQSDIEAARQLVSRPAQPAGDSFALSNF